MLKIDYKQKLFYYKKEETFSPLFIKALLAASLMHLVFFLLFYLSPFQTEPLFPFRPIAIEIDQAQNVEVGLEARPHITHHMLDKIEDLLYSKQASKDSPNLSYEKWLPLFQSTISNTLVKNWPAEKPSTLFYPLMELSVEGGALSSKPELPFLEELPVEESSQLLFSAKVENVNGKVIWLKKIEGDLDKATLLFIEQKLFDLNFSPQKTTRPFVDIKIRVNFFPKHLKENLS